MTKGSRATALSNDGHCRDFGAYADLQKELAANRIIAGLPIDEAEALEQGARLLELSRRTVLQEAGETIDHIYFPLSGVYSLVTEMRDGTTVEAATVGREGMTGLPVFLGSHAATTRTQVSISGRALRVDADRFRELVNESGSRLCGMLGRYTELLFIESAQLSACNRVHSVAERCARWLLMANDRLASNRVPTSQASLAHLLGVRRASVTKAWGDLDAAGIATPTRGAITIKDRRGLEGITCECYTLLRSHFESPSW